MKKIAITTLTLSLSLLAGCGESSNAIDLNRVSEISTNTLQAMGSKTGIDDGDKAISVFREELERALNSSRPMVYPQSFIGVSAENNGSFKGYDDKDSNHIQGADEKDLFNIEIDTENQRVLASNPGGSETASSPFGGMMTGMLLGMMMGNLMNRQRSAGVNPASKKANVKKAAPQSKKSASSPSAKSRAGSGSHASGK